VLASAITEPDEIRKRLIEQVTGTVRWRESGAWMAEQGVRTLYEIGAGKVLTGLVRRIDERLDGRAIGTVSDIESAGGQFAVAV
jgi:[acyl-carrier-protein] S-malonyltransferase